jgi:hypothetical protein
MRRLALQLAVVGLLLPWQAGAECKAVSGPATTALVELYTSEGCNSCPPADKWLSALKGDQVVPLSLHVDYWNHLGWQDRFSSPQFSQRQAQLVQRGNGRVVYTPQVVLDGRDFRPWRNTDAYDRAVRAIHSRPAQARIELAARQVRPGDWAVSFGAQVIRKHGRAIAYLALYENGLQTRVSGGENKGAVLHHDRVVRAWLGPTPVDETGQIRMQLNLKPSEAVDYTRSGVAAIIEDRDNGEVLQALAMPLCAD